ncbi:MAG: glutamate-5-semialdehyde dehydrogenase [bacterium]|nr:glutamate-5-semialdehyde dehydrogenase [bacterium]MDD7752099.1 glutamate-5-semialdehyde dehydrogenase [bacterium]
MQNSDEIKTALERMGSEAKAAARKLATATTAGKNSWLNAMADAIDANTALILAENSRDMEAGKANGLSAAMLDRLRLDEKRIKGISDGLRHVVTLPDPVGRRLDDIKRPNGLDIEKVSVPIGVIAIIYESRPNVTVDATGLCLKAGNAVILRGGSEALHSNLALAKLISDAGVKAGMPAGTIQMIPWTGHEAVSLMLKMNQYIDLVIPRGGERLIRAVVEQATMPVIKHYKGVCHTFVDESCDFNRACDIIENAKVQRPSACNAIETLLIHRNALAKFAPMIAKRLSNVELHADEAFRALVPSALPATEDDWTREYLDLKLAVRTVNSLEEAIAHINKYGSGHSDCILTDNPEHAEQFLNEVDSATVYVNASTRFTDGGEFGFGAEIGISTDKLHARGPMGLVELTSYKYKVRGSGQIRA